MAVKQKFRVIGIEEVLRMDWQFATPDESEMQHFREAVTRNLSGAVGWPPHREGLTAEKIIQKTLDLEFSLKRASLLTE